MCNIWINVTGYFCRKPQLHIFHHIHKQPSWDSVIYVLNYIYGTNICKWNKINEDSGQKCIYITNSLNSLLILFIYTTASRTSGIFKQKTRNRNKIKMRKNKWKLKKFIKKRSWKLYRSPNPNPRGVRKCNSAIFCPLSNQVGWNIKQNYWNIASYMPFLQCMCISSFDI